MAEVKESISFDESWEGATHQAVENAIKEKVSDILTGTIKTLTLTIDKGTSKSYIKSDELVQFDYFVNSSTTSNQTTTDDNDFVIEMTVAGQDVPTADIERMFNRSNWKSGDKITSPNLYDYVKNLAVDFQVIVTIRSADGTKSQSRTITFSSKIARLSTANTLILNPTELVYNAKFDTSDSGQVLDIVFKNHETGEVVEDTIEGLRGTNNIATVRIPNPISTYGLANGSYDVNANLVLADGTTRSATVYIGIVVANPNAQAGSSFLIAKLIEATNQYDNASIQILPYVVGGASKITVVLQEKDSYGLYNNKVSYVVNNGESYDVQYIVPNEKNDIRFVIEGTDTKADLSFEVKGSAVDWQAAVNPAVYLTARGMTNAAATPLVERGEEDEIWANNGNIAKFIDVPFKDGASGFVNQSYLRLIGNSKVYIKDFYPFYNNTTYSAGDRGGGLLATGMTLKLAFAISAVSDPDVKVIDCFSEVDGIGFYVTGDGIYVRIIDELVSKPGQNPALTTTNLRKFAAGSKIDLTITIQPYYQNGVQTNHEVRYYINGELAGFNTISRTTLSQTVANRTPLVIGGGAAIVDLYDIRHYNRCLSAFEVLQTRTMDLDNSADMLEIYEKNNFYTIKNGNPVFNFNSAIEYAKWMAGKLPNVGDELPFAVFLSTNMCNDTEYLNNTKEHAQLNRPERFYVFRFRKGANGGEINPAKTFMVEGESVQDADGKITGNLRMRRQGTSTAMATMGNIRVDTRGTCNYYIYDATSNQFVFDHTVGKKAKIWEIGDTYPCYLLTCKKNPNDSTHARNLPTAKWYEDCCRDLAKDVKYADCLTYPQQQELASIMSEQGLSRADAIDKIKIRQTVDGYPSVAFLIERLDDYDKLNIESFDDHSSFAGQFDMITDKTNMDVFGFGGNRDYSVEFRKNESQVCSFHTADLSGAGELTQAQYAAAVAATGKELITLDDVPNTSRGEEALQYRYPDDDRATVGGVTIGLTVDDTFQKLFDLVYSCSPKHLGQIAQKGVVSTATTLEAFGYPSRSAVSAADRAAVFKEKLGDYVCINQVLLNGLLIERGLMIDQDAKNQFFTHFTGEDKNGVELLRLLGYDFDTSWDMDNDNLLRFPYTTLYKDNLYDSYLSGSPSEFWTLVYDVFKDELNAMAAKLYADDLLKPDSFLKYMHDKHVNYYNSIIFNANSEYSYTTKSTDYTKSHGAAKEHNEWFVKGRLKFTSGAGFSPNDGSGFAENSFQARPGNDADSGKDFTLTVKAKERAYVYVGTGVSSITIVNNDAQQSVRGGLAEVTKEYETTQGSNYGNVKSETRVALPIQVKGVATGTDTRIHIFGGDKIATIDGLPDLYLTDIKWNGMCNMEELNLGRDNGSYVNTVIRTFGQLGFADAMFGSCKKLNLAGLTQLTDLNLTTFPVLEEVNCKRMTSLSGITLPTSSTTKKVYAPSNITTIEIDNKPELELYEIEKGSNSIAGEKVQNISVTNSNNYAALLALDLLNNYIA